MRRRNKEIINTTGNQFKPKPSSNSTTVTALTLQKPCGLNLCGGKFHGRLPDLHQHRKGTNTHTWWLLGTQQRITKPRASSQTENVNVLTRARTECSLGGRGKEIDITQ